MVAHCFRLLRLRERFRHALLGAAHGRLPQMEAPALLLRALSLLQQYSLLRPALVPNMLRMRLICHLLPVVPDWLLQLQCLPQACLQLMELAWGQHWWQVMDQGDASAGHQ